MSWTRQQRAYQQILADPEEERQIDQIALDLGLCPKTLCRWEEKEGFWREVNRITRAKAERALAAVWRALIGRARRGEVSAIKLLFGLLGRETESENAPQQPIQFKLIVENGNGISNQVTAAPLQEPDKDAEDS